MVARFVLVLLAAAATVSAARAADLGEFVAPPPAEFVVAPPPGFVDLPPPDCNCGSPMITIYDAEPGVVTRHWASECDCRIAPRGFAHVAGPLGPPPPELYTDPWRGR